MPSSSCTQFLKDQSVRVLSLDAMNTMIKLREPPGQVYARFAQKLGISVDPHDLTSNFKTAFKTVGELKPCYAFASGGAELWWTDVISRTFEQVTKHPDVKDHLAKSLFEYYSTVAPWKLVENDICTTLKRIKERNVRIVVTSNFDFRLRQILNSFGVSPQIDLYMLSGEQGIQKPEPEVFARIKRHFKLNNAEEILHIGDSYKLDYIAARQFGAQSLLYIPKHQPTNGTETDIPLTDKLSSLSELLLISTLE